MSAPRVASGVSVALSAYMVWCSATHLLRFSESVTWVTLVREVICAACFLFGAIVWADIAVTLWKKGAK